MTKNEAMIEVASDIVSKVHVDICNTGTKPETDEVTDLTIDILRKLIQLSQKIRQEAENDAT